MLHINSMLMLFSEHLGDFGYYKNCVNMFFFHYLDFALMDKSRSMACRDPKLREGEYYFL